MSVRSFQVSAAGARRVAALAFGSWMLAACVNGDTTLACTVSDVNMTLVTSALVVGQTSQANAQYFTQNCSPSPTLTWTSDNEAVATVNSTGLITAVAPGGPVTIRATVNGQSGTVTVTVSQVPVATVTLTPTLTTLLVGQTAQLTATPRDLGGVVLTGRTVTWTSSNTAVATVVNGLVSGVSAGSATITATIAGVEAATTLAVSVAPAGIASPGIE